MKYEQCIYTFIILMLIVFIVNYFFINKPKLTLLENKGKTKKGKKKKIKNISEIDYLVSKFQLNYDKINKRQIILIISFINSFIISFVSTIVMLLPLEIIWQLLIAFCLLISLIYSLYEIYGRHLKKQQERF